MDRERRKGEKPIPRDLEAALNDEQLMALHSLERFGWELQFIRRPLFQDPVFVVCNSDGNMLGVLEEDGRLNLQVDLEVRAPATTDKIDTAGQRASKK